MAEAASAAKGVPGRWKPTHRIEVAEPALRAELADYLRSGGWNVLEDADELSVAWTTVRAADIDRVNLSFSLAVWRAMYDHPELSATFADGSRLKEPADDDAGPPEPAALELPVVSLTELAEQLRTSLTPILGYLELLLDGEAGELTEKQQEALEIARRNAKRLGRLASEIAFATSEEEPARE
jgi:signal transduction histidine kinase